MHLKVPKTLKKKPDTGKKETVKQGSPTQYTTLTMFRDGMSMEQIATERKLSMATIENHLAVFVASGELDVTKIVPLHKIDKIMEAIHSLGAVSALKPIKDMLGDDFTYGDIRLAVEHYKKGSN